MRLGRAFVGAALLLLGWSGGAGAAGTEPTPLFGFRDRAITESSGLAVSSYDDRIVFTHNDSGDAARFFAVDGGSGATLATYRVAGADNVDWEDMAAAPDESGRPALWFADIGDNRARRTTVSLYRVPEPRVDRSRAPAVLSTRPAVRRTLRYPDGPHDAEALLVDARRDSLFIVTKSLSGATAVYAAPLRTDAATELRLVTTLSLGPGSAVTGGAVAPAGDQLVLRTYAEALAWPLGTGGVPAALRQPPRRIGLPAMPQGESAAFRSDGTLLVGSEGLHSSVYVVRPESAPAAAPTSPLPSRGTTAARARGRGVPPVTWALVGGGVLGVAGAWAVRRRRRPSSSWPVTRAARPPSQRTR